MSTAAFDVRSEQPLILIKGHTLSADILWIGSIGQAGVLPADANGSGLINRRMSERTSVRCARENARLFVREALVIDPSGSRRCKEAVA